MGIRAIRFFAIAAVLLAASISRAGMISAPTAWLDAPAVTARNFYQFTVKYNDDWKIDADSLDNHDILVTGPRHYRQEARLISTHPGGDRKTIWATYRVPAPGGRWDANDYGTYNILMRKHEVWDRDDDIYVSPGRLDKFSYMPATAAKVDLWYDWKTGHVSLHTDAVLTDLTLNSLDHLLTGSHPRHASFTDVLTDTDGRIRLSSRHGFRTYDLGAIAPAHLDPLLVEHDLRASFTAAGFVGRANAEVHVVNAVPIPEPVGLALGCLSAFLLLRRRVLCR